MNKFIPGETYVPVSGKVFDEEEINKIIVVYKKVSQLFRNRLHV